MNSFRWNLLICSHWIDRFDSLNFAMQLKFGVYPGPLEFQIRLTTIDKNIKIYILFVCVFARMERGTLTKSTFNGDWQLEWTSIESKGDTLNINCHLKSLSLISNSLSLIKKLNPLMKYFGP